METNGVTLNTHNLFTLRKSIHSFQAGIKLSEHAIHEMLRLASLAPSTWNLQHWRFLVIQNKNEKCRLLSSVYNQQQQVLDCSSVIIVLGDEKAYQNAEKILSESMELGVITQQTKEIQLQEIERTYACNQSLRRKEAIQNASLAGMQLMLVAQDRGISSCMLRFDSEQLSKELKIPSRYIPVMLVCLGYATKAPKPSLRMPLEETILCLARS